MIKLLKKLIVCKWLNNHELGLTLSIKIRVSIGLESKEHTVITYESMQEYPDLRIVICNICEEEFMVDHETYVSIWNEGWYDKEGEKWQAM